MTSKGSIMPSEKRRRAVVLSPLLLTTSQTTETGAGSGQGLSSWGHRGSPTSRVLSPDWGLKINLSTDRSPVFPAGDFEPR